jgi:glycosyltransferase involved in cell wall biosynthesis
LYEGIAVGIHVIEQARHLVKLGVEVDVLAPHHQGAVRQETIDGVRVRRLRYMWPERWQTLCYGAGIPTNLKNSWWAWAQLPLLMIVFFLSGLKHARNCDVIQANWSLAGLVGLALGRVYNKPVVLMMYGAEVFVLKDNPLLKFVIRNADHVICISEYTLKKTREVQEPKAFSVIPPGIDVRRFYKRSNTHQMQTRLGQLGIDFALPLVMALGKFIERKGFEYLIQAIALLQPDGPVQLMIGGRGPLKQKLQQQAEKLGIQQRVTFLDYIPDDELPSYYTLADVFVSPSVIDMRGDTEGLGMVLLEALACETPCVASKVGGIVDIIQDGVNGLLVQPGHPDQLAEKIRYLIVHDRVRQTLGFTGCEIVAAQFSWDMRASQIIKVYEMVIGTRLEGNPDAD